MQAQTTKQIVEAALLAAARPLNVDELLNLFGDEERPERAELRASLQALQEEYTERGFELVEVASGYRMQVKTEFSPWVSRLWLERPSRYSRALLETLALIAYRQPITRGEIEDIRGVSVSSSIMRTLQERNWIRVVGHREVPGKPAMYGTTREFLDYFNLKSLDQLPTLAELRDLDGVGTQLELDAEAEAEAAAETDAMDATDTAADNEPTGEIEASDDTHPSEPVTGTTSEVPAANDTQATTESPSAESTPPAEAGRDPRD